MYAAISFGLRAFGGFGLSALLCVTSVFITWAAYYLTDYSWPRDVYVVTWFTMMGVAAGAGTATAWLGSDVGGKARSLGWVALGVIAAWAAYYYKTAIDPNPAPFSSREVSSTAILWALLAPNLAASAIALFRQIRMGSV